VTNVANHLRTEKCEVFIHLRRKHGDKIFYFRNKDSTEVDFALKDAKTLKLIQACHSLSNPDTRERGLRSLANAMTETKTKSAFIVTGEEEEVIETRAGEVFVIPLWKFLLDHIRD